MRIDAFKLAPALLMVAMFAGIYTNPVAAQGTGFWGELKEMISSPALNQYVRTKVAPSSVPSPGGFAPVGRGNNYSGWDAMSMPRSQSQQPYLQPQYGQQRYAQQQYGQQQYSQQNVQQPFSSGTPAFRAMLPRESRALARYDISVLIDRSGSMTTADCPSPFGMGNISRWDWCKNQTAYLARETNAVARNVTVVPFAADFKRFSQARAADIHGIFQMSTPEGGTNLGDALRNELDTYFYERDNGRRTRPLLIAVISDGDPSNKSTVKRAIKEATKNMRSPGEIKITFLQVGRERSGTNFLREVDNDLTSQGATVDIVEAHEFDELLHMGLPGALASTIDRVR